MKVGSRVKLETIWPREFAPSIQQELYQSNALESLLTRKIGGLGTLTLNAPKTPVRTQSRRFRFVPFAAHIEGFQQFGHAIKTWDEGFGPIWAYLDSSRSSTCQNVRRGLGMHGELVEGYAFSKQHVSIDLNGDYLHKIDPAWCKAHGVTLDIAE